MKVWFFAGIFLCELSITSSTRAADAKGSVDISASQRFFSDSHLSYINGSSPWGAIGVKIDWTLHKFDHGIQALLGFDYIRNSSMPADTYRFQFYTPSLGLRYKPWTADYFILEPFAESLLTYRFGRVRQIQNGGPSLKLQTGGEFGMELGGGTVCSFMYDRKRRDSLRTQWNVTDFGLIASFHYLESGWGKTGLRDIQNTGGYDIGLGLFVDW